MARKESVIMAVEGPLKTKKKELLSEVKNIDKVLKAMGGKSKKEAKPRKAKAAKTEKAPKVAKPKVSKPKAAKPEVATNVE